MLVCIECQQVGTEVSKKPKFTIIFDPKFKNPNKLCVCDECLIKKYKSMVNKNPI